MPERARAPGEGPARLLPILVVLGLLACAPASALSPTQTSWPQFRGDDARLGVGPSAIPDTNETLWSRELGEQVQGSFAVVGGRALVGCDDGRLYCLDADKGATLWTFETENAMQSTPAVDGDHVYVGGLDGSVYCLRLDDGSVVWSFPCGQVVSSPALWNGTVVFADQDGRACALDAATGAEVWNATLPGPAWASPTVVGGRVYVGDIWGGFSCLDASNGTVLWDEFWEGSEVYSSAAVSNGRVLVGTGMGKTLRCLDALTGDEVWTFEPGHEVYSSTTVAGGVIYCHSWSYLWAVPWDDPDGSGTVTPEEALWSFETHDFQGGSSPAVSGDRLVVGSDAERVYCLEVASGALVWEAEMPGFVYSSPALAHGRVYIGSTGGRVSCFGEPTSPRVYTHLTPTKTEVSGGQSITIDVSVTDVSGAPGGDAFMAYSATAGTLSATFGTVVEGAFRVSWTAPQVGTTTIVTISATGELQGFEVMGAELQVTVTPAEEPPEPDVPIVMGPGLIVGLVAFAAIDAVLAVVILRRRTEMGEVPR